MCAQSPACLHIPAGWCVSPASTSIIKGFIQYLSEVCLSSATDCQCGALTVSVWHWCLWCLLTSLLTCQNVSRFSCRSEKFNLCFQNDTLHENTWTLVQWTSCVSPDMGIGALVKKKISYSVMFRRHQTTTVYGNIPCTWLADGSSFWSYVRPLQMFPGSRFNQWEQNHCSINCPCILSQKSNGV